MRGRVQALLITLATASLLLTCWISASIVALVTLRQGVVKGLWLLLWALLPSGSIAVVFGDLQPLMIIVGSTALAVVLRSAVSLPLAVLCSAVVGLVAGWIFLALAGGQLQQIADMLAQMLGQMQQEINAGASSPEVVLQAPTVSQLAAIMGLGTAVVSVLCVLLARYWQAWLYNPGGFASEFRQLYLPPVGALTLVLVAVLVVALGAQYRYWAGILAVPLVFAGFGLVHAYAKWRGKGSAWLMLFYGLWLLLDPLKWLLVLVAVTDSLINFRARWIRLDPPAQRDQDDSEEGG